MSITIVGSIVALAKEYGASASATASTIGEALDLLNDTLAGEDQPGAPTIGQAIDALSENIVPEGTKSITANGTGIDVAAYAKVDVAVPNPSTGTLEITAEGTYDVTAYASAHVEIAAPAPAPEG